MDSKIDDAEARARMVRTFEPGLSKPVGFVLPVQPWNAEAREWRWRSEKWQLRRGRLFLMPGDSAIGLQAAAWRPAMGPAVGIPYTHEQDPTQPLPPLPTMEELGKVADPEATARSRGIAWRTATQRRRCRRPSSHGVVGEPRDGILCVFMPPVERLEDYLALITVVDAHGPRDRLSGPYRRLSTTGGPAAQRDQGDAGSRRDRGQHPSGRDVAAGGGDYNPVSTRMRGSAGSAPTNT